MCEPEMCVWEKIKQILTVDTRPGTVGYQRKLCLGAGIFIEILPNLINGKKEEKAFNEDEKLKNALINRPFIEDIFKN